MNVLNITINYFPAIGGAQHYVKCVSEILAARHQVAVYATTAKNVEAVTTPGENFEPISNTLNGVQVRLFSNNYVIPPPLMRHILSQHTSFYAWGPWSYPMISSLLRCQGVEVFHSTPFSFTHNYYVYCIAKLRSIPIVITPFIHAHDRFHFHRKSLYSMLRGANAVIAQTSFEADFLRGVGVDRESIFISGMGVFPEEFRGISRRAAREKLHLSDSDFVVLFLGRKEEYKGINLILDSCRLLIGSGIKCIRFLCVGPETRYSSALMKSEAYAPLLRSRSVRNIGGIHGSDKLDVLAASDLLLLPSAHESFGGVILEAWMAGLPVIALKTSVMKCVIEEHKDGLLVRGDPLELARGMKYLLERPKLRRRMGQAGRRKVLDRYTWNHVAERVEEAFGYAIKR
jgi:glycosyltransferase involved in cell wall biosynthesis